MIYKEYSNIIELFILVAGVVGLLQKIAAMERYHQLRVVLLTTLFSLFVILLFATKVFTDPPLIRSDNPEDTFTITE